MKSKTTSQSVWIALVFFLSFLFSTLTTAGCGAGAMECGPDTCSGCCMDGVCQEGNTEDVCGAKGGFCFNCGDNACVAGSCQGDTVSISGTPRPAPATSPTGSPSTGITGGTQGGTTGVTTGVTTGGTPGDLGSGTGGSPQNPPVTSLPRWNPSTSAPSHRFSHAMVYDTSRQALVLFGGDRSTRLDETLEKHPGFGWNLRFPNTAPDRRSLHAMAYDSDRQRVILFGGDAGDRRKDTWEYSAAYGNAFWSRVDTRIEPNDRKAHAMAYDAARKNVVLFGGNVTGNNDSSETWVYTSAGWVLKSPSQAPAARHFHAMAFDGKRGELVLFGGTDRKGTVFQDTWVWNGNTWARRFPTQSPPPLLRHAMAYDSARGKVILFGGTNLREFFNHAWEWDGNDWTPVTPASGALPDARSDCAMAYNAASQKMVVTGGRNFNNPNGLSDSWELDLN